MATLLLWGIVRNHPFHDGNKRTAYVVTKTFLHLNGRTITGTEDEKFELVIGVAHQLSVDDVESWIRTHLAPFSLV